MIDPTEIDISELPYGSILRPENLPSIPCVYLCLSQKNYPVYIGQSQDFRWRWMSFHDRKQDCKRLGATKIAWISNECETLSSRKQIEKLFIEQYSPKLNIEIWTGFRCKPFFNEGVAVCGAIKDFT